MLYSTLGVHPTRCNDFVTDPEGHLNELLSLEHPRVLAWGEMGLDYDRLVHCEKEVQQAYFKMQLKACVERNPDRPFFLHMRGEDACQDFVNEIKEYTIRGVVHSFSGTEADLRALLEFPTLFIGLNGCSLKTEENLEVVKHVPLDRMLLETDAPYCGIRPTHAGHVRNFVKTTFPVVAKPNKFIEGQGVKDRNEPCRIRQVAEVIAGVHGVSVAHLARICYDNSRRLFFRK